MVDQIVQWIPEASKTITDILQSAAILITLIFTFIQLRRSDQSNRTLIALELTAAHREIWKLLFESPQLSRILEEKPDIENTPIVKQEKIFVNFVIRHMAAVFSANKQGMFTVRDVYKTDLADFLVLPIPNRVWQDIKKYQTPEFAKFIDSLLENKNQ